MLGVPRLWYILPYKCTSQLSWCKPFHQSQHAGILITLVSEGAEVWSYSFSSDDLARKPGPTLIEQPLAIASCHLRRENHSFDYVAMVDFPCTSRCPYFLVRADSLTSTWAPESELCELLHNKEVMKLGRGHVEANLREFGRDGYHQVSYYRQISESIRLG